MSPATSYGDVKYLQKITTNTNFHNGCNADQKHIKTYYGTVKFMTGQKMVLKCQTTKIIYIVMITV